MRPYTERCCGKVAASPPVADLSRVRDNVCPHEFFVVRRNAKTGEFDYVAVEASPSWYEWI